MAQTLPADFLQAMQSLLPAAEYDPFVRALSDSESPTSIRLNRSKCTAAEAQAYAELPGVRPVPWCPEGWYLPERPTFTTDPLLHAGVYYVQEAASMFLTYLLRQLLPPERPVTALDLCAAPGGKSSALLSVLPEGSALVSNEIDRRRARILAENLTKWGNPALTVTAEAPAAFTPLRHLFDLVLTDVPCSGEGMFRKDPGAVSDWSLVKVRDCARLQRQILDDVWPALKPGGLLVYSTCTFNPQEDEEQVRYLCETLGAEVLTVPVPTEWQIHAALRGDDTVYRFMPHGTVGEGLFVAVVRKGEEGAAARRAEGGRRPAGGKRRESKGAATLKGLLPQVAGWLQPAAGYDYELTDDGVLRALPQQQVALHRHLSEAGLYRLQSGVELATLKGRDLIPAHALALSTALRSEAFATAALSRDQALSYLRRDTLMPDVAWSRGYVLLTYEGHPLGFVKNMGNRCNNLYPQEWRIRFL
jgi:16S rRNA C967 or C1407 C5-methylase (RsmB/RsmF family)/NOL1/NOP2/fmu family ribosome biogenesis protein